jgi:hypothetical protein
MQIEGNDATQKNFVEGEIREPEFNDRLIPGF